MGSAAADPAHPRRAAPAHVSDGLAVYDLGAGPPLLLMPNPQGMVRAPEAHSPLADLLIGLGRRVVSFDPPGAFASSRPPRLGLANMLACSHQALQVAGVAPPVDVVGHSQATLCQLALALAAPLMVRGLVLVGAVDGGWRTTAGPLACPGAGRSPTLGVGASPSWRPRWRSGGPTWVGSSGFSSSTGRLVGGPQPGPASPDRAGRPAAA